MLGKGKPSTEKSKLKLADTESTAVFVHHKADPTTVRSAGASIGFGDFAGFVVGAPGTALAFTNAGGRAVVFGDGCDMALDNW